MKLINDPFELCARALVDGEAFSRYLDGPLEVENVKVFPDVPVVLRREAELRRLADHAHDRVIVLVPSDGRR